MNIVNTPFNVNAINPVEHDQVQACWRYILATADSLEKYVLAISGGGQFQVGQEKIPLTLLVITKRACDNFKSLAEQVHNDEKLNLDAFTAGADYTKWHQNYPGFHYEATDDFMFFKREFVHIFKKQLNWECTRWNLDVNTMKGCLFGWAVEYQKLNDALAQAKFKKFIGYSGQPILLSKVSSSVTTKPAISVKLGKGKGSRQKGFGKKKVFRKKVFRKKGKGRKGRKFF